MRGAASLSAQEALAQHAIDLIATDVPDLLRQLDGRKVRIAERDIVLHTAGAAVTRVSPDWRDELLIMLTHPTIAYGLLLIGIYGLLLEGYNPGAVLPGVVGALSLVLALYAFELLAVNFAGVALLILGAGLIVLELFMPAFGSLGIGGLIAFVIGSIILFDNPSQGLHMALPLIVGIAIAGALMVAAISWLAARARAQAGGNRCRGDDRRARRSRLADRAMSAWSVTAENSGMRMRRSPCTLVSKRASSGFQDSRSG